MTVTNILLHSSNIINAVLFFMIIKTVVYRVAQN